MNFENIFYWNGRELCQGHALTGDTIFLPNLSTLDNIKEEEGVDDE